MSDTVNLTDAAISTTLEQQGHKYQSDIDSAQNAINAGSALSFISSLLHGLVAVVLVFLAIAALKENGPAVLLLPYLFGIAAVVLSWAVVYALLSIVTTNGISAKHTVIQSSKIEKSVSQTANQTENDHNI